MRRVVGGVRRLFIVRAQFVAYFVFLVYLGVQRSLYSQVHGLVHGRVTLQGSSVAVVCRGAEQLPDSAA